MNKKFSTLVAALLVTGGSFAMVSQYAGTALAESPLAMAAAANLRATEIVSYNLKAEAFDPAKATVWTLAGGKLKTAENYYLTAEGKLNKDVNSAATGLSYENGHIKNSSGAVLAISGEAVSFQSPLTGTPVTLFNTSDNTQETAGQSSYVSYMGEEVKTYAQGANAKALQVAASVYDYDMVTGTYSEAAAAAVPKVAEVVASTFNDGKKFLQVKTAGGTKKFVNVNANTNAVTFIDGQPVGSDYDASALTGGTNGILMLGSKYLYYTSTSEGYDIAVVGSISAGDGMYLYTPGESSVETSLEAGEFALVNVMAANATSLANAFNHITFELANGSVNGSSEISSAEAQQKFDVAVAGTSFRLSIGADKLTNAGGVGETAGDFTLDADGAIKSGAAYLGLKDDGSLSTTEGRKLYLYTEVGADKTPVKALSSLGADAKVWVAPTNVTVNALSTSIKVAQAKAVQQTTTEPNENLKNLIEGTSYYISNNGKYLSLNTDGTALIPSSEGQLWKVSIVNAGAGKFYSFTNQYGQALAFDVTGGVAKYAADGEYSQFFVNEFGEILFEAEDKVYEVNIESSSITVKKYVESEYAKNVQNIFDAASVQTVDPGKSIELLNKTYGTGNGFGIMFKNMEITEDKVKDMTLESNPFSDATLITAVPGMNFTSSARATTAKANLGGKMFLKVSGSYPLTGADENNVDKQIDAFRASMFIAVDTVRYSSLVPDYNNENKFFKYVTVSGASMLSKRGYVFDGAAEEYQFGRGEKLEGVTRRVENAEFTLKQIQGGTVTDNIQLVVSAYIPDAANGEKVALMGHKVTAIEGLELTIKNFNGKNYLGAGAAAWNYVYVGMNNDVDYKTINGIVTLISRNYETDGQVYASTTSGYDVDLVLPKYVCTDKPEGQFLVTGGFTQNGKIQSFTFTNRESGAKIRWAGFKKTDKANVYATADGDTIEIKAASTANEFVGYANYDKDVLANTQYVLKVVSNAAGIKDIYIAEDHNKDHSLGLNADTLEAANFKLIKFERAADKAKYIDYGDTVFVSREGDKYSYVAVDKKTKEEYYDLAEDRVVAFTYAIYNADNGEYLDVNDRQGTTLAQYLYCNPNKKYGEAKDDDIQRFIIKEKANGAVQLIPVDLHNSDFEGSFDDLPEKVQFQDYDDTKLYAGISDNKVNEQYDIYKIADNDLFTIQQIGAPLYRTLDVTGNVRIYKEGMPNIALFAESADKALVSGQNLLGMEHKADADLNKTMFSFMLDTAYVDRANNYTPQYLLAIDATTTPGGMWCETHQSATCEHAVETPGYVKGSYLVSLADSAAAVAASQAHKNPYMYDGYNRLGFVKATHIGDKLAIERAKAVKADTLDLTGMTKASFALRIVDQATQSFALQNADGYVKWLNGVPVLVGDFALAEVLNIESTENAATANEAIEAAGVQVIGGKGAVTVQGAAGKVITVANVLGQTIANQVAASDNVTIAAPAGVVVVAVEGEATKVVVK